ncbi:MAG: flagellar protein FlaG [Colwellia sp.]|nr:flagellar protein FlaG [Colwellia sp.]
MSNYVNSLPPLVDVGRSAPLNPPNQVDVGGRAKNSVDAVQSGQEIALNKSKEVESKEVESKEVDISEALNVISDFAQNSMKNVSFKNDNSSGKTVITVFDKETHEVISQFPSEKIIKMAEKIKDLQNELSDLSGLLIDDVV